MRQSVARVMGLGLGVIGIASCNSSSSSGGAAAPTGPTTALTPGLSMQQTAKGTRIFGPQVELIRDEEGIRGQCAMGVVDLREEKGVVSGIIGSGTTNLHIIPAAGNDFNIRGMFAGKVGDLVVQKDKIQGQLGQCQYDLHAVAPADAESRAYNGQRRCGMGSQATTFTMSPQIAEMDLTERGALIAILLGR
jgi:hypothetical protein